ncbi:hypothetical protein [Phytoactinopolyspora mesophila]|uniref:DUF5709 domain-containing protein n=1 Tax=Phytoactinopolyspora mesophila TaxID=2650750 RepID=A0A7K3LXZ8_9ACTN|nr:hypothetical protein [Phytoactinopolyspora mesophila]NDL55911.1 hypothetical protein [Phytoactinopolyspora mesophila]
MSMSDERPLAAGEEMPEVQDAHRDPGADLEAEGVPEVADESTTGKGEVPEPEEPIAPGETPTVRTAREMGQGPEHAPRGIEGHLAAEEPEHLPDHGPGADFDDDEPHPDDRTGSPEESALHVEDDSTVP